MKENKSSKGKIFLFFLLIMAAGIGANYFTSLKSFADNVSNQYGAALILAINGKTVEVRNFIGDKILPKNPEEQRKELISELKDSLNQIKNRTLLNDKGATSTVMAAANNDLVKKLINNSEQIVSQLETVNGNTGIVQTATDRILDVILPIKENAIECKN